MSPASSSPGRRKASGGCARDTFGPRFTLVAVPRVHVTAESTASPDEVLEAARDFSPRRAELWRDVYIEHVTIHDRGETWADVTEGNPWPIGLVWERLRYDWSEPGTLKGRVIDSNIFRSGSTWEIRATPRIAGGSRVEILAVRDLRGRGWLVWPSSRPGSTGRRQLPSSVPREGRGDRTRRARVERVRQVLAHPAADLAAFAKGTFGQTRHRF
jgi:hypothetical protein